MSVVNFYVPSRNLLRHKPPRKSSSLASSSQYGEVASHHIDFGDLPPIDQMKQAITRRTVSSGITYLLPYDKTKCSVENVYRNDLRHMFREPYRSVDLRYDEKHTRASVRHHLTPNTVPRPFTRKPTKHGDYQLNSESQQVRNLYFTSAPARGITGKLTTVDCDELRPRSTLYLPIRAKLPPEAERMKQEAERILRSVREKAEAEYDARNASENNNHHTENDEKKIKIKKKVKVKKIKKRARISMDGEDNEADQTMGTRIKRKTKKDETYENFKQIIPATRPPLPESFESPYLNSEKNQEIWSWMTKGEAFDDFNYFIKICS